LWEGRFKSQALLDDAAVLSCMAYVDLNPIRAKMAKTPETSQHTSIKKRTESIQQNKRQPHNLLPFVGNPRQDMPQGIAFSLQDYCELVDTTDRIIRADDASIQNAYPKKTDRWDETGQTTTIVRIANKNSPLFYAFLIEEDEIYIKISRSLLPP
jgi:hypothetical protein